MKIAEAERLYIEGHSIKEAAKLSGVARTTLQRHLQKLGVTRRYTPRTKRIEDLAGQQFGKLRVIEPSIEDEGRVKWLCVCKCGNTQKVRTSHLKTGKIDRCGSCAVTGERSFAWKGCGKLSGTYWKRLKANAKRRASGPVKFEIDITYAWELYEKQNGCCALTGLPIPMPTRVEDGFVASLDRIDSSKGYIQGNVQWVHKHVNTMKWDFDQDYFFELCRLISERREAKCSGC